MRQRATGYTDRNAERWDRHINLCLEHRRDDIYYQHKYGRELQCHSNGYEGLHGIRHRDTHGRSVPIGIRQQPNTMLEHITSDVNGYAERRDGCITFAWSSGATTSTISTSTAGTYTVTVT